MSVNSKMTALADSIRAKSGASGLLGLDDMRTSVDGMVTPDATLTYSQVNTAAAAYLAYCAAHPYDPDDYSGSYITQFTTGVTNGDKPLGAAVSVKSGKLTVLDSMGTVQTKTVTDGTQTIYNIAPVSGGDYVNTDANNDTAGCGHLIPTGALRMISCPSAHNVRDLGGWACDGGTVKYGKLFRGALPSASDRTVLSEQLGVSAHIDLRGRAEAQNAQSSPLGDDIEYFLYDSYAMYSISDGTLWKAILTDVFRCVSEGKPVYFNCSMGADRTGTLACILEGILGVSQADLDTDYELTCFYTPRARNGNYQGGTADWAHLISAIASQQGTDLQDKLSGWMQTIGISVEQINAFRQSMIDGTPETLSSTVQTFTVGNTLSHASSDNDAVSARQYLSYSAEIRPENGYIINSVQVLMGGVDITSDVFDGVFTPSGILRITENGRHIVGDYLKIDVDVAGQQPRSFTATVTLDDDVTSTQLLVTDSNAQLASIRSLQSASATIMRTQPDTTLNAINVETVTNMYHGSSGYSGLSMIGNGGNVNVYWTYYKLDYELQGFGGLYITDSGQIGIGATDDAFLSAGSYIITVSW